MDSEHRHELAQNDLEKYGKKLFGQYNTYMEENGNRVLLYACLAMLTVAVLVWYVRSSSATNAEGWAQLSASMASAEDLASVAESFPGTQVAEWALLRKAEVNLLNATGLMFTNREPAVKELEEARKGFEQLAGDSGLPDEIKVRTLFGLARALETSSDGSEGDLKKAIEQYQKVIDQFPDSLQAELSEKRIQVLNKPATSEFYAWFQKQTPQPPDRKDPSDGLPANLPEGGLGLPTAPGLNSEDGPNFGTTPILPGFGDPEEGDSKTPTETEMKKDPEKEVTDPFPTKDQIKDTEKKKEAEKTSEGAAKPKDSEGEKKTTETSEAEKATGQEKPAESEATEKPNKEDTPKVEKEAAENPSPTNKTEEANEKTEKKTEE